MTKLTATQNDVEVLGFCWRSSVKIDKRPKFCRNKIADGMTVTLPVLDRNNSRRRLSLVKTMNLRTLQMKDTYK